jgi:hypothetical protein
MHGIDAIGIGLIAHGLGAPTQRAGTFDDRDMPGTRRHPQTVRTWRQLEQLPERHRMEPKLCTPAYFHEPLREPWDCGVTRGRALFALIQGLGYTGSQSHLARYLAPWRSGGRCPRASDDLQPSSMTLETPETKIPPVAGAALCMAFRGTLSRRQQDTLDRFTAALPQFAAMRKLATNFRAILFGADSARLDAWLTEANASGPHHIRSFAGWLMRDLQAVRNAISYQESCCRGVRRSSPRRVEVAHGRVRF